MEEIITKDSNRATIVEIITKDSNRATIVEIITKDSKQGHYGGDYKQKNQPGPLWRKCKQWNNRTIEQRKKP